MKLLRCLFLFLLAATGLVAADPRGVAGLAPIAMRVERVGAGPVIRPEMMPAHIGENINGPSMIRVPDWVEQPLGRYYLYFAHHHDDHIRMAYADDPEGPFTWLEGGVLRLDQQTAIRDHIASPDVVIDEANRRIVMVYHGSNLEEGGSQMSGVAASADGIHFTPLGGAVERAYLRVFRHGEYWYAFTHSGELRRTAELGRPFERVGRMIGPEIIAAVDPYRLGEPGARPPEQRTAGGKHRYSMRHVGLDVCGDWLVVYFSCVGHRPERILATFVPLQGPDETWRARGVVEVLQPETAWEGADRPLEYSEGGISEERVRQLRDPQVFREGERAWLLYTVAGEKGIGLARLHYEPAEPEILNPKCHSAGQQNPKGSAP